ncbi:hypothetical protein JW905_18860 [bacterium]|nr:hypothetical protein [candidate division CSSED10-310 bacterium]
MTIPLLPDPSKKIGGIRPPANLDKAKGPGGADFAALVTPRSVAPDASTGPSNYLDSIKSVIGTSGAMDRADRKNEVIRLTVDRIIEDSNLVRSLPGDARTVLRDRLTEYLGGDPLFNSKLESLLDRIEESLS